MKQIPFPSLPSLALATSIAAFFSCTTIDLHAQSTWNGNANGTWSNSSNWDTLPGNNAALVFAGSNNLASTNDFLSSISSLSFSSNAGAFVLGGNALSLGGNITDSSTASETVNIPLTLTAASNVNVATGGSLSLIGGLAGTSSLTKSGNGTLNLGAVSYTGATLLDGGTVKFNSDTTLTGLTFGATAGSTNASTIDLTSANLTLTSLTAQTFGNSNTIQIGAGKTLRVNGNVTIGTDPVNTAQTTRINLTSGGAFIANGSTFTIGAVSTGSGANTGIFDASSLSSFTYNPGSTGTLNVGNGQRGTGTLNLANADTSATNLITVGTINIGTAGNSNAGTGNFNLGSGTNTINANTINIASGKSSGNFKFTGTNGSLVIRNAAGTGRTNFTVGNRSSTGTGTTAGTMTLTGHSVDIMAGTMIIGQEVSAAAGVVGSGTLAFDTGTIDVTTLTIGNMTSTTTAALVNGTVTVGTGAGSTGTLIVGSGFTLGNNTNATGTATAIFEVKGGLATINANIVKGTTTGAINATVTLSGGKLDMTGHAIGTSAATINTINFPSVGSSATLANLGGTGINGNGLTMTGTGTLILSGTNTYSGPTNVNAGTLSITGSAPAAGTVTVIGSGTLSGTGSAGTVTMETNSSLRPGLTSSLGDVGTLTIGGLVVHGGDFAFDFGNSTDLLTVTGLADFQGNSTFSPLFIGSPIPGTYTLLTAGSLNLGTTPTVNPPAGGGGFTYDLDFTEANKIKLVVGGTATSLSWTGAASNVWDFTAANWSGSSTVYTDGAILNFGNTGNNRDINVTVPVQPAGVTFNNDTGHSYTVSGIGWIDGATGLTKVGTGTVILTTDNTYTGGTTIFAGTLQLGNGGATGSILGNVTGTGGTLAINRSDDLSLNNIVDGAVSLAKAGTNTVTIANAQNYTGTTTISGGTLQIGDGGVTGSIISNVTGTSGTVAFNRLDDQTFSNTISGAIGLTKLATNQLTLSGNNSYTGPTNINAGKVRITSFNALGASPGGTVTVQPGGALDIGGITTVNAAGFGTKQFNIAGDGVSNSGAIFDSSSTAQQNAFQNITLFGDASIGGIGRFDMRGGTPLLNLAGYTLTKNGTNQFSLVGANVTNGNIVVNSGNFSIETTSTITGSGTITYNAGTTAQFFVTTANTLNVTRPMIFNGSGITVSNANSIALTIGSPISLNNNLLFSQTNTGAVTLTGGISDVLVDTPTVPAGPGSITKSGTHLVTLGGTNTFSGTTTLNSGTLVLSGTLSGTSSVAANGGTLRLGASDRINDLASLTLGTGSTFDAAGFSDTVGVLTLSVASSSAILDLGAGASVLHFADSSASTWTGALQINNWSGSPTGSGTDQVYFGNSSSGLSASELAMITFFDPFGAGTGSFGATMLATGEIVAVPEPNTAAALLGGLGVLLLRRFRRAQRVS